MENGFKKNQKFKRTFESKFPLFLKSIIGLPNPLNKCLEKSSNQDFPKILRWVSNVDLSNFDSLLKPFKRGYLNKTYRKYQGLLKVYF